MRSAYLDTEASGGAWESPNGGVVLDGGYNFGSTLYDAALCDNDGMVTEVSAVVCDPCIAAAVARGEAREVRKRPSAGDCFGLVRGCTPRTAC